MELEQVAVDAEVSWTSNSGNPQSAYGLRRADHRGFDGSWAARTKQERWEMFGNGIDLSQPGLRREKGGRLRPLSVRRGSAKGAHHITNKRVVRRARMARGCAAEVA
jgi:hypothetical protein